MAHIMKLVFVRADTLSRIGDPKEAPASIIYKHVRAQKGLYAYPTKHALFYDLPCCCTVVVSRSTLPVRKEALGLTFHSDKNLATAFRSTVDTVPEDGVRLNHQSIVLV